MSAEHLSDKPKPSFTYKKYDIPIDLLSYPYFAMFKTAFTITFFMKR